MPDIHQPYLRPYVEAMQRHGLSTQALLWINEGTQRLRFDALVRAIDLTGRRVLDAGCGRADLLDYLLGRNMTPAHYIGLEALDEFLIDARRRFAEQHEIAQFIAGDFVTRPAGLFVGADVIVFSGSLNTLSVDDFHGVLRRAFEAASVAVAFNFLSSGELAGAPYLAWHRRAAVEAFGRSIGAARIHSIADYMNGDCTCVFERPAAAEDLGNSSSQREVGDK